MGTYKIVYEFKRNGDFGTRQNTTFVSAMDNLDARRHFEKKHKDCKIISCKKDISI